MDWDGDKLCGGNGFETSPETPPLIRDFAEASLCFQPSSEFIPSDELSLFTRPLLGANSLALQLFEEFEDDITESDNGKYFLLDLNVVLSPESTDERNIVQDEYGDNVVVCDSYARYRMRLVSVKEEYVTPRGEDGLRHRIVYLGVRDKQDRGNVLELYLNKDDGVEANFKVDEEENERKAATPDQQLIVAAMIDDLLNPEPLDP